MAGDTSLYTPSFFFWNSGNREQKSQQGLLRSLLFQVLNQQPELIPIVLPLTWARTYKRMVKSNAGIFNESWTVRRLKSGLKFLVKQKLYPMKLCLFIDGLDEFDGDPEDMAELFINITTPNVKVCLSSRPWIVFEDYFKECAGLRLQDLTVADIRKYVTSKLTSNDAFKKLSTRDPNAANAFSREIVEKADGVFLWVTLVVKSLLNGIRNRDGIPELQKRLGNLPRELEPLYDHLLDQIEPEYFEWSSKAFQMLKAGEHLQFITILAMHLALDDKLDVDKVQRWPLAATQRNCDNTEIQLTARCAGLLEVWHLARSKPDSQVHYLHRTVKEYLMKPRVWCNFEHKTDSSSFNPEVSLFKSSVLQLAMNAQRGFKVPFPARSQDWQYDMANQALEHAFRAEHHTYKAPPEIFMEFDNIMSTYARKGIIGTFKLSHWSLEFTNRRGLAPCRSFLPVAVMYGLFSYLQHSMQVDGGKKPLKDSSPPLLHYAIPFVTTDVRFYPRPQPQVIQQLLDANGDPNIEFNGLSPWQQALNYAQQQYAFEWQTRREQLEFLQIAVMMLNAGADPNIHLEIGGQPYTVQWILLIAEHKQTISTPHGYSQEELVKMDPNVILELDKAIKETYRLAKSLLVLSEYSNNGAIIVQGGGEVPGPVNGLTKVKGRKRDAMREWIGRMIS